MLNIMHVKQTLLFKFQLDATDVLVYRYSYSYGYCQTANLF